MVGFLNNAINQVMHQFNVAAIQASKYEICWVWYDPNKSFPRAYSIYNAMLNVW